MDTEHKPIIEIFFGKNRDQKKEFIIVSFITLYIAIRTFVNQDFIYLLTFYDLRATFVTLGNIFNDLIMAYIPIGVLILTSKGARYRGSKISERFMTSILSLIAPIFFVLIFYIAIIFEMIISQPTNSIISEIIAYILIPIKVLIIIMIVVSIVYFMSLLVNNVIMIIFLLLENHKKDSKTLEISEDMYIENNYINVYNYWFYYEYKPTLRIKKYKRDIYFVKVFIKSKKENKAIINVYLEDDTLILINKKTNISVLNGMKESELEEKINVIAKEEVEKIKSIINSQSNPNN